jgi:hypothetical protein
VGSPHTLLRTVAIKPLQTLMPEADDHNQHVTLQAFDDAHTSSPQAMRLAAITFAGKDV